MQNYNICKNKIIGGIRKLQDKYNMTQEQNVFLAKRNIVDSIWKSAHIEGINITFPETRKII